MQHKAFTLIELLVVLSIIGPLIAILLPALGQTRRAAERAQCVSNMHQVVIASLNCVFSLKPMTAVGPKKAKSPSKCLNFRKRLKRNGLQLITVPNAECLKSSV